MKNRTDSAKRLLALGSVTLSLLACEGTMTPPVDASQDRAPSGDATSDALPVDASPVDASPPDVTPALDVANDQSPADASDVGDVTDASDATDAMDVTDAADATDVTDAADATDVTDAADVTDAPDVADATDASACRADGAVDGGCDAAASCVGDASCGARVCTPGEATCVTSASRRVCDADGAAFTTTACASGQVCLAGVCAVCPDADGDGLSDAIEGAPSIDTDRDGTPDFMDSDSDNDGFSDAIEGGRRYPGFDAAGRALTCGAAADNCDGAGDRVANFQDTDSDNDGLSDAAERAARTDPCAEDTDGDGASDLVETAVGTDPTAPSSSPPASATIVTLPYHAPSTTGAHEHRVFTVSARVRAADVFFLVDNSTSMDPIINQLRTSFSAMVAPAIRATIPDVAFGVGSFDSMPVAPQGMPGSPGDYTLWIRQPMSADVAATQRAFDAMRTVDADTGSMFYGGDEPECQTEAAFQVIAGAGTRGHEADALALRSVRNARDPGGNGWVPAVDPVRDCGAADRFGWGCFGAGRVPLIVLASDSNWYDGCVASSPTSRGVGRDCAELTAALNARGAWFLGIDVGLGATGRTYANALPLAMATGTVDGAGAPVILGVGSSGVAGLSSSLPGAIVTLLGQSRSDVTARVVADATERRLPTGRTTADFVRGVTTVRATPEAPEGYARRDASTFFGASPSASLAFDVDLYNDLAPGADGARVYAVTVQFVGRASSPVESRTLYLLVPPSAP